MTIVIDDHILFDKLAGRASGELGMKPVAVACSPPEPGTTG